MLSASFMLRSLLSFILFLALKRVVVLADDEDYDPCKAGKFESQFLLQFDVPRLPFFLSMNQSFLVLIGNYANSFGLVSSPII